MFESGKHAKRRGSIRVRDARKLDQEPPKPPPGTPPHKWPRTYVLTVITRRLEIHYKTYSYATKAERDRAKATMKREASKRTDHRYWWFLKRDPRDSHDVEIEYEESMK